MRILVATDAWHPQVNGVVRTLAMTAEAASAFGAEISFTMVFLPHEGHLVSGASEIFCNSSE